MKKILILSMSILFLASCEKEDYMDCECGTVTNDYFTGNTYTLTVTNDCTNNTETFYVDFSTWFNHSIGERVCFSNQSNWIKTNNNNN